ncbi:MAG: aspartate aminotransferase family protein [Chloroflexi bacterium]|nr:aspartate aminotransferase family protein [Chloroflexota bacterium]
MSRWIDLEKKYYMPVTRRQPIVLVKGRGARVWDEEGKEYLDFVAGWAVNSLGHCHPVVVEAVEKQVSTLVLASNQFYTLPQLELAQFLAENSCLDRVFFQNSGAEANEGAVKLARKYGKVHLGGAYKIITALNSFHGRTLTMVSATGQPHYQEPFTPLTPGFVHVPFNDVEAIKEATDGETCAIMLEPVQGEGGVIIPASDYLQKVRQWCDEKGLLLILDEVQTGMGRLGTLFGYQHFNVEPDVMTLGKGLGGGIAIGAFLAKERCVALQPSDHGTTFGGNPVACAAALAVSRYIVGKDIPSHVARLGEYLKGRLELLRARYEIIREVRGLGLLLAVEFWENISGELVSACNSEGLLVNPVRPNAIRLMPPLTLTPEEVDEAVRRLDRALGKVLKEEGQKAVPQPG